MCGNLDFSTKLWDISVHRSFIALNSAISLVLWHILIQVAQKEKKIVAHDLDYRMPQKQISIYCLGSATLA